MVRTNPKTKISVPSDQMSTRPTTVARRARSGRMLASRALVRIGASALKTSSSIEVTNSRATALRSSSPRSTVFTSHRQPNHSSTASLTARSTRAASAILAARARSGAGRSCLRRYLRLRRCSAPSSFLREAPRPRPQVWRPRAAH